MNDEASGSGSHIREIDRHELCSASLAKLRARSLPAGEVPSEVGTRIYNTPIHTSPSVCDGVRPRGGSVRARRFPIHQFRNWPSGGACFIALVYGVRGSAAEYL